MKKTFLFLAILLISVNSFADSLHYIAADSGLADQDYSEMVVVTDVIYPDADISFDLRVNSYEQSTYYNQTYKTFFAEASVEYSNGALELLSNEEGYKQASYLLPANDYYYIDCVARVATAEVYATW